MMVPQDEATLVRLLGSDEIPDDVRKEYAIRIRMYHSNGHSGPLGAVGLIDMVRFLGLGRQYEPKEEPKPVDWRKQVPNKTRIEANFFGQWHPGVYTGAVDSGSIGVLLDGEVVVREVYGHVVRLAEGDTVSPVEKEDLPDARIELVNKTEQPAETPPVEPKVVEPSVPEVVVPPVQEEVKFEKGMKVWADLDGDIVDGEVLTVMPEGLLRVKLDGCDEPQLRLAKDVTPAG